MSLNDLVTKVTAVFKADTTQMRASLRTLSGEERAFTKASIEGAEARNKSIDGWTDKIKGAGRTLKDLAGTFKYLGEAAEAFDDMQDLAAGSAAYNLDRLRKSSLGLKTDTDLLRLAQAAQQTTFKLTQDQLETATKAMRAFEEAGFDGAAVQEAMGEAITKGSIKPLKEFGINLDIVKGKAGAYNQLMTVLAKKAREAGTETAGQADEFKKAGVEYKNAMNQIKVAIGELVVSLAPLITALAKVASTVADIVGDVMGPDAVTNSDNWGYLLNRGLRDKTGMGKVGKDTKGFYIYSDMAKQYGAVDQANDVFKSSVAAYGQNMGSLAGGLNDKIFAPKKKGTGRKDPKTPIGFIELENTGEIVPVYGNYVADATSRAGAFLSGLGRGSSSGDMGLGQMLGASAGPTDAMFGRAQASLDSYTKFDAEQFAAKLADLNKFVTEGQAQERHSFLASMFGELEEFNAYSTAFDVLAGSASAGFDAWVSGSASAGAAMKKFFKDAIAGLASQMFVEALKHGAYAIGSLAMHDPVGAATHAKAAAAFAAGAIVAGGLAKTMGGGASAGGAASGGGGRAPSVGGGGSASGGGPVVNNYYVGDYLSPDNPRQRRPELNRAVRMANRESRDSEIVRYS